MKKLTALLFALVAASAIAQPKVPASFVTSAKSRLTAGFKDPNGAQYQGLFIALAGPGKVPTLCGSVNGKNSYGAYTGFRRFYADADSAEIEDSSESMTMFGDVYGMVCAKKIRDVK